MDEPTADERELQELRQAWAIEDEWRELRLRVVAAESRATELEEALRDLAMWFRALAEGEHWSMEDGVRALEAEDRARALLPPVPAQEGGAVSATRRKWYGWLHEAGQTTGVIQTGERLRREVRENKQLRLPEHVLRLADAEYQRQFGGSQDYERMQERSGLSLYEVVGLLADYIDRLGGEPSKPSPPPPDRGSTHP